MGTSKETHVNASSWKCPGDFLNRFFFQSETQITGWTGGKSAPQNCPSPEFRMSTDGTQCVCKPRFYQSPTNPKVCVPCPVGHMCPDGLLVKCPIHHFQAATESTSCDRCTTTGDANGYFTNCLTRGSLLQYCDPAVANTQDQPLEQLCLPCNQCRRAYTQAVNDPNLRNCYRGK